MASRKQLKKEFEYLSSQMIGDCLDFIDTFEGKDKDVWEIIDATVTLHNGIIDRVNHPDGKDNKKLTRAYYKHIKIDYIGGLNQGYGKLEQILKAGK